MVSETENVLETVFFRVFTGRTFVIEAVHRYNGLLIIEREVMM